MADLTLDEALALAHSTRDVPCERCGGTGTGTLGPMTCPAGCLGEGRAGERYLRRHSERWPEALQVLEDEVRRLQAQVGLQESGAGGPR